MSNSIRLVNGLISKGNKCPFINECKCSCKLENKSALVDFSCATARAFDIEIFYDVKKLRELESKQNDGRGIDCVKTILIYIEHGMWNEACYVRRLEGDKTRSYREVELQLLKIFGCRLHLDKNCQNKLCKDLRREYLK